MKILLDTNVLVRAAITPEGLAQKLLSHIEQGDERVLIVSSHILDEVADVLRRSHIQKRWPLTEDDI